MRTTRTLQLSNCEVDIIDYLTWGEKEKLQASLLKGAKINQNGLDSFDASIMLQAKYELLELAVKEIREGGERKTFTREWVDGLSIEDGDLLYEEVDKLNKKKM